MEMGLESVAAVMVAGALVMTTPLRADSPLGEQMEKVDSAYKRLKKTTDAAEGVKEARDGQAAVIKAIELVPEMISKVPAGADKDKALAEYKAMMGELYVRFCRLELAFLSGKNDEVTKILDDMKGLKKQGHGQFIEEEDD